MNNSWASPLLRSRYPLAILAGLLLAASLPKIGIAGLAWVAPGLMLAVALGKGGAESFRIGYVAGLAYYLASLYWLLLIPYRWHSIPLGPAAGWLSLSAYVALYPAVWVWLLSSPRGPPPAKLGGRSVCAQLDPADGMGHFRRCAVGRAGNAGGAALLGLSLEPAGILPIPNGAADSNRLRHGHLWRVVPAVWVSLSLLSAGFMVVLRPNLRSIWVGEIFLPVVVVALVFNFGIPAAPGGRPAVTRTLKVTLVQPSIPQTLIWDTSRDQERFRDFIRLSEQALTNHTDLLVWPEAAVPSYARWDTNIYPAITNLVRQHHVWLILGSDDMGRAAQAARRRRIRVLQRELPRSPRTANSSRAIVKRNLVVFGEYIPLVQWLPFVKWFTPIEGGFTPGRSAASPSC